MRERTGGWEGGGGGGEWLTLLRMERLSGYVDWGAEVGGKGADEESNEVGGWCQTLRTALDIINSYLQSSIGETQT